MKFKSILYAGFFLIYMGCTDTIKLRDTQWKLKPLLGCYNLISFTSLDSFLYEHCGMGVLHTGVYSLNRQKLLLQIEDYVSQVDTIKGKEIVFSIQFKYANGIFKTDTILKSNPMFGHYDATVVLRRLE